MNNWNKSWTIPTAVLAGCAVIGAVTLTRGNLSSALPTAQLPVFSKPVQLEAKSNVTPGGKYESLEALDEQFANLVDSIEPSVVHIMSGKDNMGAQGSGVIYRADGWIVTNDHVVSGQDTVTVVLANGKEYQGKVTRSGDIRNDIAVVKIDANNLPSAPFADDTARVGQFAIAVGTPFGLENTVTIGHISATGRDSMAGDGMQETRVYSSLLQTDAPINPGNSGGPLLNVHGQVVGINTSIYSQGAFMGQAGNVGIGFAIPSAQAKLVADLLISKGKLVRGYLGVAPRALKPYELDEKHLSGGAFVLEVPANSPASKAGLKANDIITKVGQVTIKSDQDILNSMLQYAPGTSVTVEYNRDGQNKSASVKVGEFPKEVTQTPQQRQFQTPKGWNGDGEMPKKLKEWLDNPDNNFSFPGWDDEDNAIKPNDKAQTPRTYTGKPVLGVQIHDADAATKTQFNVPSNVEGAVVTSVEANSLAADLGLKPGCVITKLNGKTIKTSADVVEAMKLAEKGKQGSIEYGMYSKSGVSSMVRQFQY